MSRLLVAAASTSVCLFLAGTPAEGLSEEDSSADLARQCAAIVQTGEAYLRGDPGSTEVAASTFRSVRDGLASCRDPRVEPQTRVRLLLIASNIGETNDPKAARLILEEAHEIVLAEAPRSREHVLVLEALSGNAFGFAEYAAARQYMEEALRLREELWGEASTEAMDGRIALAHYELVEASALSEPGDFSAAFAKARAALERSQRLFGEDAGVTARAWVTYAAVLRAIGQIDKAQELFEQHVLPRLEHLDEPLGEVPRPTRP